MHIVNANHFVAENRQAGNSSGLFDGSFGTADPGIPGYKHKGRLSTFFIAFRSFDFLDKHISIQQNLVINSWRF